jgi:hypothetical protein
MPPVRPANHPLWLLTAFGISVAISIAAVIRRLIVLLHPSSGRPPQTAELDAAFSSHAALTMMHIVPAGIFVLLAAGVLLRRSSILWLESAFFLFGAITAATAYAMNAYAIGGAIERSAVLIFNTWFLFSLIRAYVFHLSGDAVNKRIWMTRAVGILLGIATTRPVIGFFFATSGKTHMTPSQFFGIAFWIGFSINAIAVELWLRSKRIAH